MSLLSFPQKQHNMAVRMKSEQIEVYKTRMVGKHEDLKVIPAGLILYLKNPCFGASPDSFVECKCCGAGVLNVPL